MTDHLITASRLALLSGGAFLMLGLTAPGQGLAQGTDGDFDTTTQIGPDPVLPDPSFVNLIPHLKVASVIGWAEGETPKVPEGMTITAYAKDLGNPRTVHTLPNGDVLVIQSKGPAGEPVTRPKDFIRGWIMSIAHGSPSGTPPETNKITLLRDTDRDGTVDERHDLLTDLHSPFGVAWIDDTLYVAAADAVLSYPYALGDNIVDAQPTILTPLPGGPINHHWTKDLALSPDGTMLYAGVGSNSNITENGIEAEKGRAAVWQIDRKTGAAKVYASGLRNPNGLTFNPDTGALWAVINERDELGPNLVPDYMTSVQEGAFYGWPYSYYGDHVDQRVRPQRPDLVETAIAPDYALSSHVAALGLIFSKGSALPQEYADGAFIGEHGSWNRDAFNGYKVVYVPFTNGKPDGMAQDVVTGFIDGDEAHGRPVGVGIDGTGALLVADDAGNTVWRVAAADGTISDAAFGTDSVQQETPAAQSATPAADTSATTPQPLSPVDNVAPQAAPADNAAPADSKPAPGTVAPAVLPRSPSAQAPADQQPAGN